MHSTYYRHAEHAITSVSIKCIQRKKVFNPIFSIVTCTNTQLFTVSLNPALNTLHPPTHQVADGLRALAVLIPLRLKRRLQADALLLQAQLAALQHAAFVLQLAAVGLQLLQLLAALRLGFSEPHRRIGLSPQQRVDLFQLMGRRESTKQTDGRTTLLLCTFLFVNN